MGCFGPPWGVSMNLLRRTLWSAPMAPAGSAPGTGRGLLRAVSLAGPPYRPPEGDGRVRAASFVGLRAVHGVARGAVWSRLGRPGSKRPEGRFCELPLYGVLGSWQRKL